MSDGDNFESLSKDLVACEDVIGRLEAGMKPVPQEEVIKTIGKLEEIQQILNSSQFVNDSLEDTPTSSMNLLLVDVYLGRALEDKRDNDRKVLLERVKSLYNSYLITAELYGFSPLFDEDNEEDRKSSANSNVAEMLAREKKMKIYKIASDLEKEVNYLGEQVRKGAHDEEKRKFNEKKLRLWCIKALQMTDMINKELEMLNFRDNMTSEQRDEMRKHSPSNPIKTRFIPKRETVKSQVFGAGYPSLATQTVNEWYDQQIKSGRFPGPSQKPVTITGHEEDKGDENAHEDDGTYKEREERDEEERQKKNRMDEYKDINPRGWGNMHGKG